MKGWKTLVFNLLLVIGPPGLAYLASVNWADYLSPTWAPVLVGIVGIALRMVTTTPAGKSDNTVQFTPTGRKLVIGLLTGTGGIFALIAAMPIAHAADLKLPAKAAPIPFVNAAPCTLQSCSGFYIGGDLLESGGNFDVVGTGLTGLAQNNLALGGHAGYEFWNGKWFAAFEAGADYGVVQNGALPGGGNHGLWDVYGLGKLGYDFSGIFGAGANGTATPTLPQSIANALMSPYVILGVWDRPWGAGLASGAGLQALLATNWTLSVDYIHVNYNNANVNANVSEQTENLIRAAVDYHF